MIGIHWMLSGRVWIVHCPVDLYFGSRCWDRKCPCLTRNIFSVGASISVCSMPFTVFPPSAHGCPNTPCLLSWTGGNAPFRDFVRCVGCPLALHAFTSEPTNSILVGYTEQMPLNFEVESRQQNARRVFNPTGWYATEFCVNETERHSPHILSKIVELCCIPQSPSHTSIIPSSAKNLLPSQEVTSSVIALWTKMLLRQ